MLPCHIVAVLDTNSHGILTENGAYICALQRMLPCSNVLLLTSMSNIAEQKTNIAVNTTDWQRLNVQGGMALSCGRLLGHSGDGSTD